MANVASFAFVSEWIREECVVVMLLVVKWGLHHHSCECFSILRRVAYVE